MTKYYNEPPFCIYDYNDAECKRALERLDSMLTSITRLHKQLKETADENEFLRAGVQEAEELFETVRANHDWTEKRYAWLDKYGKKKK